MLKSDRGTRLGTVNSLLLEEWPGALDAVWMHNACQQQRELLARCCGSIALTVQYREPRLQGMYLRRCTAVGPTTDVLQMRRQGMPHATCKLGLAAFSAQPCGCETDCCSSALVDMHTALIAPSVW